MNISEILAQYKRGTLTSSEVKKILRKMHDDGLRNSLSEGQQGLWVLQKTFPEMSAYNVPLCFRIENLNIECFKVACEYLIQQQPLLQVIFGEEEGVPYQKIKGGSSFLYGDEDLSDFNFEEILVCLQTKVRQIFCLDSEVMRIHLVKVSERETIVLFVIHHIVFDGMSAQVLMRTLFDAYKVLLSGGIPELSQPVKGYFDFAQQELAMLTGAEGASRLAYWRKILSGPLPTLVLPTAHPRNQDHNQFVGKVVSSKLPVSLSNNLRYLSGVQGCYTSTIFLAVFKSLLNKYTGDTDIIVGMPVNERGTEYYHDVVGYFINMMPIRSELRDDFSFAYVLNTLQRTMINSMVNSYPLSALVRELEFAGTGSGKPIFQAAFVYQDFFENVKAEGFSVDFVPGVHQEGEYDLMLEVSEMHNEFLVNWKFNPELFDENSMVRMSTHYIKLMEQLIHAPDMLISDCSLLDDDEARILANWNQTQSNYPKDKCIHELFEAQARLSPKAIALEYNDQQMTYAELERRSVSVAKVLQAEGVKPGILVAICMDRSLDLVVGLLGILKAGGAYVPLDPLHPLERLQSILDDCQAKILITDNDRIESLNQLKSGIKLLSPESSFQFSNKHFKNKKIKSYAHQAMYVLYTSGSTGKPKGVMLEHQALCNRLVWMQNQYPLTASDAVLQKTPFTFDVSVWEFFWPLIAGARLVLLPPQQHKDPYAVRDAIQQKNITTLHFVPSMLQVFLEIDGIENCMSLKRVFCSGEALTVNQNNRFFERLNSELHNLYGPTEAAIDVSYFACRPGMTDGVPIGKPIANTQLYIVDKHNRLVSIGVPGELCIAGDGLARGYLNRPELTAEKFIDNPFGSGKLYRTGDVARWRVDGDIEYLGRVDFQVKVRGFRIELGEIESQLNRHDAVQDCAVVVREHEGLKQLVAYYIPALKSLPHQGVASIKSHLQKALPDYMLPDFYVELTSFPLTANGKLDRKTLSLRKIVLGESPVVDKAASVLVGNQSRAGVGQWLDAEDKLLALWKEVLHVEALSVTDGFFEVGGNSLLAVILSDRIGHEFAVPFRASSLFHYPTIRQLAEHLSGPGPDAEPQVLPPGVDKPGQPAAVVREVSGNHPAYYQDSVAIIGISCHFPGAEHYRQFWDNICAGKEGARFFNADELRARGIADSLIRNPNYVPMEQGIVGKDLFDSGFFNIPPKNAALMDPQFRLLLQHSWQAIEDAGYVAKDIPQTGVFMSASNHYYQTLLRNSNSISESDEYVAWVLAQGGTIPTMISYGLGLKGPSLFVHTNCSSSLVALSSACNSLKQGDADYALVGAATVMPSMHIGYLYQPGLNFSSDGHCKTFDAAADGLTPGEGVAVLVVKRALLAVEDGDHIYALIRGVGVNNDGSDKAGFYAPSVAGQLEVIDKVLKSTGIDPRTIGYVEAHGTGTRLGDPIEVSALSEAYRAYTREKQYCALGSVKSNIGHLDAAAGLAGCIKVALSLQHRAIAPSINYHTPNPEIDFANSPFYVVTTHQSWAAEEFPRRAALSSFGIGGTNAHAILEEYVDTSPSVTAHGKTDKPYVIPLSAKNAERLQALVDKLLRHLHETIDEAITLEALGYTLQVGREAMASRVVFISTSVNALIDQLQGYLNDRHAISGCYQGELGKSTDAVRYDEQDEDLQEAIARWIRKGKITQLAKHWVKGGVVDWALLYGSTPPQRLSLPTYPFAKDRYWIDALPTLPVIAGSLKSQLHPLVHENTSTGFDIRFSSQFSGSEFFFADHQVQGQKVLPGTGYLEMARVAIGKTLELAPEQPLVISDVVWLRPMVMMDGEVMTVHISVNLLSERVAEFDIYTLTEAGDEVIYSQGRGEVLDVGDIPHLDLAAVQDMCRDQVITGEAIYALYAQVGVDYGVAHRGIVDLRTGMDGHQRLQVLGRLALAASVENAGFGLHPGLFDSALQTGIGLTLSDSVVRDKALLPFALESLKIYSSLPAIAYAWVRYSAGHQSGGVVHKLDISICDEAGKICADLQRFTSRKLNDPLATETSSVLLFEPQWEIEPEPSVSEVVLVEHRIYLVGEISAQNYKSLQNILPAGVLCERIQVAENNIAERFEQTAKQVFLKLKQCLAENARETRCLQFVIHNVNDDALACLSGLSSLLKTANKENPKLLLQTIEVAMEWPWDLEKLLLKDIQDFSAQEIRYAKDENGKRLRYVKRLREIHERSNNAINPAFSGRDGGVYLITGGLGGLGRIMGKAIAEQRKGAVLILTGRSELTNKTQANLVELRARGVEVEYRITDMADRVAVNFLMDYIRENHGQLTGVIHSAGVIQDNFIMKKSEQEFARVLAPKVSGLVNLDEASRQFDLEFFVCFSSASSVLGNPGQADYAVANGFMDHYSHYRNKLVERGECQGKSIVINWPQWAEGGMTLDAAIQTQLLRLGFTPMDTAAGLSVLSHCMESGIGQVLVLSGKRQQLKNLLSTMSKPALPIKPQSINSNDKTLLHKVHKMLLQRVSTLLKISVDDLDIETELNEYGFDSISLTTLANELGQTHDIRISPTIFFEYATLGNLANYLVNEYSYKLLYLMDAKGAANALVNSVSHPVDNHYVLSKLCNALLQRVSALLAIPIVDLDLDSELIEFGFDSISLTTLANELAQNYGIGISPTIFFEYATLRAFASYLLSEYGDLLAQKLLENDVVSIRTNSVMTTQVETDKALLQKIQKMLLQQISSLLKISVDDLDLEGEFSEYGFDSISLTTLANELGQAYKIMLSPTIFFEYATLGDFANYLVSEHSKTLSKAIHLNNVVATTTINTPEIATVNNYRTRRSHRGLNPVVRQNPTAAMPKPIAIIGMSGCFPQAPDIATFWRNLCAGKDCISEVPINRWDWREFYGDPETEPNKTKVKWGGFIEGIDLFDPLFFGISPSEAVTMDPHQRLVLMHSWKAIEDAGYAPGSLSGSDTAVLVGTTSTGYSNLVAQAGMPLEGHTPTGLCTSVGPARVSYLLNLHGPSEPIDTACSSGLVAIHRAVELLQQNKVTLALAGGVSTIITPALHICYGKAGMLSEDGRCKTFSEDADGYGRGEGIGIFVLKLLQDAERDGDHIYGKILSSAENHGGRANSLTAPNSRAQAELLTKAYRQAGIDPRTVTYLEAHGTGTKLGDPVEIDGIRKAFNRLYEETEKSGLKGNPRCGLGSVKSNIGHLEHAAGAAALIKVLLQLKNKILVRNLHSEILNPYINLQDSPFYVVQQSQPWKALRDSENREIPRRAGVSSFGFGGVNAHIVVEEYVASMEKIETNTFEKINYLVLLSAKTDKQILAQAKNLLLHIEEQAFSDKDLESFCYTLQVGREAMEVRVATIVENMVSLKEKLTQLVNEPVKNSSDVYVDWYRGSTKKNKDALADIAADEDGQNMVSMWLAKGKYDRLLELWVKGWSFDWKRLYQSRLLPKRMALPTYPFALARYWPKVFAPDTDQKQSTPELRPSGNSSNENEFTQCSPTYIAEWKNISAPKQDNASKSLYAREPETILLVYKNTSENFEEIIQEHYQENHPDTRLITVCLGDKTEKISANSWICNFEDIDSLSVCFEDIYTLDIVYFLSMDHEFEKFDVHGQINTDPDLGKIEQQFLSLIKQLSTLESRKNVGEYLDLYILTLDNHTLYGRPLNYKVSGLTGLAYSIAQNEHRYRVRSIDLSRNDIVDRSKHKKTLNAIHSVAAQDRGASIKLDSGIQYIQTFTALQWEKDSHIASGLKEAGVYVILGGSGDIGRVITRFLIEKYNANVVWIASSPSESKVVQEKIESCKSSSRSPLYIQADATDLSSLNAAVEKIKKIHPRVDGAIFAASPTSTDGTIWDTNDTKFKNNVTVKILGGTNFFFAFENEALDFMCYFSSVQAYPFISAKSTTAYSAGITYLDKFAKNIASISDFPVGIINWGYWEASAKNSLIKQKIEKYFSFIKDHEGFDVFEKFTGALEKGRLDQIIYMKASHLIEELIELNKSEIISAIKKTVNPPSNLSAYLSKHDWRDMLKKALPEVSKEEFDDWVSDMLYLQLEDMNVFSELSDWMDANDIAKKVGILDKYKLWWNDCCLQILESADYISRNAGTIKLEKGSNALSTRKILESVKVRSNKFLADEKLKESVELAIRCTENIKDILTGEKIATNVFFPVSSMEKVEKFYKNDSISKHFNEIVADLVEQYLIGNKNIFDAQGLRIIEVGAGTGATSEIVLSKLASYQSSIDEYCYTDISKAFLINGREQYLKKSPFLDFKLWNVEEPANNQKVLTDSYDILIATNILHATKNIRKTLRNIKAVLKRNGIVIINELVEKTSLQALTFGLLDGWWRYEDSELRIPGSPLLNQEMWTKVLTEEGFYNIALANKSLNLFGQQVMVAVSDGIIRQQISNNNILKELPVKEFHQSSLGPDGFAGENQVANQKIKMEQVKKESYRETEIYVRNAIIESLEKSSEIPKYQIGNSVPFSDYGIDSILGLKFIRLIKSALDINVDTTAIYDYPTVKQLVDHLLNDFGDELALSDPIKISPEDKLYFDVNRSQSDNNTVEADRAIDKGGKKKRRYVNDVITEALAKSSEILKTEIENTVPFSEYGIDSILGLKFIRLIKENLNIELWTTAIYDHPTVKLLADYLLETYEEKIDLPNKDSDRNAQNFLKHITKDICKNDGRKKFSSKIECKDIAVIGMSIQCPKAKNTEEFWQNLIQGEDCIKELPEHYLDQKKYFSKEKSSGKTYCKWGGIIEDRYMFDPAFFNISSQEAALLNPHQRLVLLESWRALEDAGYNPKHLANEDVGVFIGAEPLGDYSSSFAGSSEAIIASRLSYFLNLKGPALLVNTGCSSSAVAIHLGCESLRHHESNISVVGGVFAALSGEALVNLSGTDMLSPQGKCRPFDTSSDGTIISEGIGVVVLKRLDDAASAGDSIYGVIKGSGINQDGASNGITAPNGQSQERLITSIYNNFDILAENISYVEAHGTATPLGDAIEVNALVRAFGKLTEKQEFCILGCSKANIGHTMAASGVIGLIRILLSLKYRTIPPQINFHKLSPSIRLEGSAFSIAQEAQNWSSEGNIPLTAALNSFGHSGTNAHLVIQEYTPSYSYDNHVVEPNLDGALLIPLSAKTQESLLLYADRLYKSLEKIFLVAADKHTLSDIAYTLQVGREAMQERVLFSANSISEFKELLAHFIAGNKHENVWMGSVESDEDENREYEGRLQNIETVAKAWISGVNINWLDLYWSDIKPKRAHLPTYPFAIDQFNWISIKNSSTQQQAIYLSEEGLNGSKFDEDSSSRIIKFSSNGSERQLKKKMSANEKAKLFVRFLVAKQLRIEPTDLKENLAIYDLGITSSDIICITKEINKNISPKFMADVFFSCRTTKEITRHLAEHYSTALENIDLSVLLSDKRSSIPQVPNHENADLLLQALKSVKRGSLDIEDVIESIDLGIY